MASAAPDQDAADVTAVLAAHWDFYPDDDGVWRCGGCDAVIDAGGLDAGLRAHIAAVLLASEPYTRGAAAVETVARVEGVHRRLSGCDCDRAVRGHNAHLPTAASPAGLCGRAQPSPRSDRTTPRRHTMAERTTESEAITVALSGHWFRVFYSGPGPRDVGCDCGWRQPSDDHNQDRHNAHLADVLAGIRGAS